MSGIQLAEANLDVAESDQVAIGNRAGLAIWNALTVDVRPVGRARVRDQQRALWVHLQRRMNFRHARMIQVEIVVGATPEVQTVAALSETELDLARAFGARDARTHRYLGRCFFARARPGLAPLLLLITLLEFLCELAKGRIDGDATGEDVDLSFDLHGSHRAIAAVVDVIDRRGQDFGFEPLGNLRWCFRMRAPFHLEFQMMGRDPAAAGFVADAFVNHAIHPVNQLVRRQAAPRINRAPQLASDNVTHTSTNAADQTRRHDR